jgi:hypothetical protein
MAQAIQYPREATSGPFIVPPDDGFHCRVESFL